GGTSAGLQGDGVAGAGGAGRPARGDGAQGQRGPAQGDHRADAWRTARGPRQLSACNVPRRGQRLHSGAAAAMEPAAAADRRQTIERPRSTGARIAIRAQLRKLALRRALFFPRLGTTRLRKVIRRGVVFTHFGGRKASKTRVNALVAAHPSSLQKSFAKRMDCRVKPDNDSRPVGLNGCWY